MAKFISVKLMALKKEKKKQQTNKNQTLLLK